MSIFRFWKTKDSNSPVFFTGVVSAETPIILNPGDRVGVRRRRKSDNDNPGKNYWFAELFVFPPDRDDDNRGGNSGGASGDDDIPF